MAIQLLGLDHSGAMADVVIADSTATRAPVFFSIAPANCWPSCDTAPRRRQMTAAGLPSRVSSVWRRIGRRSIRFGPAAVAVMAARPIPIRAIPKKTRPSWAAAIFRLAIHRVPPVFRAISNILLQPTRKRTVLLINSGRVHGAFPHGTMFGRGTSAWILWTVLKT